jgi:hypothetical protein
MSKKLPLCLALTFAALFIVACGDDEKDSSQAKLDAACGRAIRVYGAKDCSALGGPTSSSGATNTATVTITSTVTN